MRVRWLPRALQNAAEAAAYIAGDRPIAERLAQYPELKVVELCGNGSMLVSAR
jgi:hypothetical protein